MTLRAAIVASSDGPFDFIGGLPLHPLVVHVAVVVLPAAALALIVVALLPRVHWMLRWGVVAALAVGALSAWVAAESGEALADRVGEPEVHEELGENLPAIAAVTLAFSIVWGIIAELSARATRATAATESGAGPSRALLVLRIVISVAAVMMAAFAIYYTIMVGHSGAVATWFPRVGG
ncbi:DUF2231 domain-containing protein [Microcella sp.]|uniref:DUF2231 domain-containing protein n=1 Tax=Microcella sp. TaxID=1913979 RepID=UPI00256BF19F|nr:DUF2231 domain-containing protein [Microcella sp.]MBX9471528.1 hypothetical protein [Microcella sp.]